MTYKYIAYFSSGNVNSGKVNSGEEILRVTAEGEFIWNENADEMIASGDYSQHPSLRHVLKALREAERIKAENERLREVVDACYVYANDTLSGPANGSDDREYYREGIIEIRNRARQLSTIGSAVAARAAIDAAMGAKP